MSKIMDMDDDSIISFYMEYLRPNGENDLFDERLIKTEDQRKSIGKIIIERMYEPIALSEERKAYYKRRFADALNKKK